MVGASREMVSRVMKDLEDRGFIETREDGSMLIKDRLDDAGVMQLRAACNRGCDAYRRSSGACPACR